MRYWASTSAAMLAAGGVAVAFAPAAHAQWRISPNINPLPPPSCQTEPVALSKGEEELAATVEFARLEKPATYLRSIGAADWVRLKGAANDTSVYSVTIAAKFARDSNAALPVCTAVRWRPSDGPLFARDARKVAGSVWQIEIRVAALAAAHPVVVMRSRDSSIERDEKVATASLFALSCEDWSPTDATRHQPRGFAAKIRLEVSAPPIAPGFAERRQHDVRGALLDAAALWVRACRECQPEHLAIVSVDGIDYLRPSLARYLGSAEAAQVVQNPAKAEAELRDRLEDNTFLRAGNEEAPRIKQLEPYIPAGSLGVLDAFCAGKVGAGDAPLFVKVQTAVCNRTSLPASYRTRIQLRLREDGGTFCGTDPDIIACRADNVLTELNIRDFRFRTGDPSASFGNGAIELDLLPVVVHEMGHWIGLPHIDSGSSIMAATADRARCIDEGTISVLAANLTSSMTGPLPFRFQGETAGAAERPAQRGN